MSKHSTDRVDGVIIAECPNAEHRDDPHLQAEVEYGQAKPDNVADEFLEAFGNECRECGTEIDYIVQEEPSEVIE
jgi:hypothetical protein